MNYDEFYQAKFIGKKEYCGFKRNHLYSIKVSENKNCGIKITVFGEDGFEMVCPYCNLKSVLRVWEVNDK